MKCAVETIRYIVIALAVIVLVVMVADMVYAAEAEPGQDVITPYGAEQMNPFTFSMEAYWLEQIYYQMNDLNLTVLQYRNQLNGMHLTSQMALQETRNYHQRTMASEAEMLKLIYWLLALLSFITALLVVLIFAMPWGEK